MAFYVLKPASSALNILQCPSKECKLLFTNAQTEREILRVLKETAGVCTPGKGELGDRESLKPIHTFRH